MSKKEAHKVDAKDEGCRCRHQDDPAWVDYLDYRAGLREYPPEVQELLNHVASCPDCTELLSQSLRYFEMVRRCRARRAPSNLRARIISLTLQAQRRASR